MAAIEGVSAQGLTVTLVKCCQELGMMSRTRKHKRKIRDTHAHTSSKAPVREGW